MRANCTVDYCVHQTNMIERNYLESGVVNEQQRDQNMDESFQQENRKTENFQFYPITNYNIRVKFLEFCSHRLLI